MLQKESFTFNADTSNFKKLKIFHIYKHGQGKIGTLGFFTFSSIREFYHPEIYVDEKKKRPKKTRSCIVQTRKYTPHHDHQALKGQNNISTLFIPNIPKDNIRLRTPIFYSIKRAKYLAQANNIL